MRVGFRNIKSKHSAAGCAWQVSGMSRAGSGPPPSGPALARTSLNSDVARLVTVANDTPAPRAAAVGQLRRCAPTHKALTS